MQECCETDGVDGSAIKPWMEAVLRRWHAVDPPSGTEQRMNDIVCSERFQGNRNPYIDHPDWVDLVNFSIGLEY